MCAMTGSKALSCICPASAGPVTVASAPITVEAAWYLRDDRIHLPGQGSAWKLHAHETVNVDAALQVAWARHRIRHD